MVLISNLLIFNSKLCAILLFGGYLTPTVTLFASFNLCFNCLKRVYQRLNDIKPDVEIPEPIGKFNELLESYIGCNALPYAMVTYCVIIVLDKKNRTSYDKLGISIVQVLILLVCGFFRSSLFIFLPLLLKSSLPNSTDALMLVYVLIIFLITSTVILASYYDKKPLEYGDIFLIEIPAYWVSLLFS